MKARRGVVPAIVGLVGVLAGSLVSLSQSTPLSAADAKTACPSSELPPITGHVTNMATARTIERVAARWTELYKAVLIVKTPGSTTWPCASAVPITHAHDVQPVLDSGGRPYVNAATRSAMVSEATSAYRAVSTPSNMKDSEWWIKGAISVVTQNGEDVGGGQYPRSFTIKNQTTTTATVQEKVDVWEDSVSPGHVHPKYHHKPEDIGVYDLWLVLSPDGRWRVNMDQFGFLPAGEP